MKKQRTSRTWMVTLEGTDEEYKIVGVSSAEEAVAKAKELGMMATTARPMRKFKMIDATIETVEKPATPSQPITAAPIAETGNV